MKQLVVADGKAPCPVHHWDGMELHAVKQGCGRRGCGRRRRVRHSVDEQRTLRSATPSGQEASAAARSTHTISTTASTSRRRSASAVASAVTQRPRGAPRASAPPRAAARSGVHRHPLSSCSIPWFDVLPRVRVRPLQATELQ